MTDCQFLYRTFRPDGHSERVPAEIIALHSYYSPQSDALCCNTILRCKGFGRFRVSIDTGSSTRSGRIELWTSSGWTEIHTVRAKDLTVTRPIDRAVRATDFKEDVEELVRVACEVLEG